MLGLNPAQIFDCVLVRLIIDDAMVDATQQNAVVLTVKVHTRNAGRPSRAVSGLTDDVGFLADESIPVGGVRSVLDERFAAHTACPGCLSP